MFLVLFLLLQARTGFRAGSRVVQAVALFFGIDWEIPNHTTSRTWLLRISLYQLTRPQEQADDWIWIIDHTVQLGQEKCLAVLGLRRRDLPPPGECLRLEHLKPLALLPVTHSDQLVVLEQLRATAKRTGVPRAILSDHGSDLHAGIKRFCKDNSHTVNLYDIAHKAANMLKARLQKDERWKSFCHHAGQTKFQTQQTELAFLVPPTQRSKARFMNLEPLLHWGDATLRLVDKPPPEVLKHVSVERLHEKFGWLRDYRNELRQWGEYQTLLSASVDEIRRYGYGSAAAYEVALRITPLVESSEGRQLKDELVTFVEGESTALQLGERLPGSSEVLESAFGKHKSISGDHQTGGFTSMLLGLAALVGRIDRDTIYQALVSVPWRQVCAWVSSNLGQTYLSKRRMAYQSLNSAQQNQREP